jgi:hypothetical protein
VFGRVHERSLPRKGRHPGAAIRRCLNVLFERDGILSRVSCADDSAQNTH